MDCKNSCLHETDLHPEKGLGGGDLHRSRLIKFSVKNRNPQLALLLPVQRLPLSSAVRAARSEVCRIEYSNQLVANPPMEF
ncbi:hypothetical protein E2562_030707 [Oryza meyeriana var. granulata]|uniref:Uncharacterized protein n=1 Tax=Oryza meyeriana var. granulata TaxID=110450 RepID=A0A6G1CWU2_9ORYZ|nr:hypothetical protein E2562_030707 [Oryza meyeriana var. granulata]